MGSFAYCNNCGAGLSNPTFENSINGYIECPAALCGEEFKLDEYHKEQALIELESRVTQLEIDLTDTCENLASTIKLFTFYIASMEES